MTAEKLALMKFFERKMKTTMIFVAMLMLVGCASHTGVVPIGKDTYMVAKQQATGFPGLGNMKAEIISEGNSYCETQNKKFQIVSTTESQPPYILGNYPRAEITFMCIYADDPELQRPKLQRGADMVIKVEK